MKKLAILFLCLFFWRCHSQPEIIPIKLQTEELEVIKQTFPDANFPAWRLVKPPSNQPKVVNDSSFKIRLNNQTWFVKDSLFNPTSFRIGNEYHRDSRIKLDTVFFDLQRKLFANIYPKQAAKLAGLSFKDYSFISIDSIATLPKIPKRYLTITRVVFNPNHTKACYYVTYFFQKSYSANGEILFAEKKFDQWCLIYRLPYWTRN